MKALAGRGEGRLYAPTVISLAAALAAAALVLGVLTLTALIGPFRVLGGASPGAHADLALWLPASSVSLPPAERVRRLRAWRAAAGRDRSVEAVARLADAGRRVVALPDARTLSRDEAEELRAFLRAGGGVVLSGAIGVRAPDGSWRGWELMSELLSVPEVVPRDRESSRALRAARRGPLTAALAPGRRVPLHAEPGVPAVAGADAELEWPHDGARAAGASRRLRVGRGRMVWLAAGPESADEEVARQLFVGGDLPRLLDAAVAWAAREPFVEVLAWPAGAPLGALLERAPEAALLRPEALAGVAGASARRRVLDASIAEAALTGGLFRLSLPRSAVPEPGRSALFAHATRRLRERGAWFGGRGDVARWRRLQRGLEARIERVGPRRRLIELANRSAETLHGAVLRVHLNDALHSALLGRTTLQQEPPEIRLDLPAEQLDVRLPPLPGGSQQAYTLDLESAMDEA